MGLQDVWQSAELACATISSDAVQNERLLEQVAEFTRQNWPNVELVDYHIDLI